MNQRQLYKYRAEWAKAWKKLREHGVAAGDQEKTRKRWHVLIGAVYLRGPEIGQPKSSTVLTNAEFDRFLKRCAAAHTPDGLAEQLALDDQPLVRLAYATDPLLDLVKMHMDKRAAYLAGIYRNIQRPRAAKGERVFELAEMPDADLQTVLIALTHTVEHKLRVDHNHIHTGKGPRSRCDHQVGSRSPEPAAPVVEDDLHPRHDPDPAYVEPKDGEAPF
jgi:hypothetical protein